MSRKDYVAVAEAIERTKDDSHDVLDSYSVLKIAAQRVADVFAQDNPRFNRTRFMTACGFTHDGS